MSTFQQITTYFCYYFFPFPSTQFLATHSILCARQIFTDHITSFFPTGGLREGGGCWTLVHACSGQGGGRRAVDLLPVLCSGTHRPPEILAAVCPEQGIDIRGWRGSRIEPYLTNYLMLHDSVESIGDRVIYEM